MMQNEFNYILVSGEKDGGQFYNSCNQELDFTGDYEVCMQDMLFPNGGWSTVRLGENRIEDHYHTDAEYVYVKPGNYKTAKQLIDAVNDVIPEGYGKILEKDGNYVYIVDKTHWIRPCKELAIQLGAIIHPSETIPWFGDTLKVAIDKVRVAKNTLQFSSVYADFIENTMIGPNIAPLLRMVPIPYESGHLEHSMFSFQ